MFSNHSTIRVALTSLQNGTAIQERGETMLSAEDRAIYFEKVNAQTRLHFLAGRLLARQLFRALCPGHTFALKTDALGKPFFPARPYWGVSIAHSGNMAACAVCTGGQVGIDLEMVRPVDFAAFDTCFLPEEWAFIHQHTDPLFAFFTLWTKKEAIAKADGRGLGMDFRSIDTLSDAISSCITIPLELGAEYVAALAYTPATGSPVISTEKIRLDDLLSYAAESTKFTR